jgi:hypothetical protein
VYRLYDLCALMNAVDAALCGSLRQRLFESIIRLGGPVAAELKLHFSLATGITHLIVALITLPTGRASADPTMSTGDYHSHS